VAIGNARSRTGQRPVGTLQTKTSARLAGRRDLSPEGRLASAAGLNSGSRGGVNLGRSDECNDMLPSLIPPIACRCSIPVAAGRTPAEYVTRDADAATGLPVAGDQRDAQQY